MWNRDGQVTDYLIVSARDVERARSVRWHVNNHGYAVGSTVPGKAQEMAHRWLLGAPKGTILDHINGNQLDCTRSNLRYATPGENMQNRRKQWGKSGYRGVFKHPNGRYRAAVILKYQYHHLGYFDTAEEASAACIAWRGAHMPFSTD
jgi:hypothetical protein